MLRTEKKKKKKKKVEDQEDQEEVVEDAVSVVAVIVVLSIMFPPCTITISLIVRLFVWIWVGIYADATIQASGIIETIHLGNVYDNTLIYFYNTIS